MALQRINWVDSAKGLGILCVVMGHTHVPTEVHHFIYSFHMPLFFMLSGIFLLQKERTLNEELKRKALSLLVPYGVFNLVHLVFLKLLLPWIKGQLLSMTELLTTLQGIVVGDRMHSWLWFLPCLFGAELLIVVCARICRRTDWAGVVLLVLGCLLNAFVAKPLPMSADNMMIAAGFIAAGIWFRNHSPKFSWGAIILLAVAYTVFSNLSLDSLHGRSIEMYVCRYGNYLYFVGAALSAICLILGFIRKVPNNPILCWLGKNSLLIYCLHTLLLQIPYAVEKRLPTFLPDKDWQNLVVSLLSTVFVCLAMVPLVYAVNRYAPWMLGKKREHL